MLQLCRRRHNAYIIIGADGNNATAAKFAQLAPCSLCRCDAYRQRPASLPVWRWAIQVARNCSGSSVKASDD